METKGTRLETAIGEAQGRVGPSLILDLTEFFSVPPRKPQVFKNGTLGDLFDLPVFQEAGLQ